MTFAAIQEQLLPQIESYLKYFLNQLDFQQSPEMKQMIAYHMGWENDQHDHRGKRIRPLLSLLCAGACESDFSAAMPGAGAVEFLHNFTLIHDDIQDNASIRHNQPTLWRVWGVPQAINTGDALFTIAQLSLLRLQKTTDKETMLKISENFNQVCLHLTQGQHLDISFETKPVVELETYLEMIEGKTAALIAFSAKLGGWAAGKQERTIRLLSEFGKNLGLAFQIQDDYLGVWGDPEIIGKSTASDLFAKKKTLPNLYGLAHSTEFQELWQNNPLSADQVSKMAALLTKCGAKNYVIKKANACTQQAFRALEALFPKPNEFSRAIFELTEQLLHRNA